MLETKLWRRCPRSTGFAQPVPPGEAVQGPWGPSHARFQDWAEVATLCLVGPGIHATIGPFLEIPSWC